MIARGTLVLAVIALIPLLAIFVTYALDRHHDRRWEAEHPEIANWTPGKDGDA